MQFFECSIDGSQSFSSPSLFSLVLINSDKHVASPSLFFCDSVLSTLAGVELSADWLSFLTFFWLSLGEVACERASRQRSVCPGWASPPARAPHAKPSLYVNQALPLPWNRERVHKETDSVFGDSAFSSLGFCSLAAVSMQVTCGS